MMIKTSFFRN